MRFLQGWAADTFNPSDCIGFLLLVFCHPTQLFVPYPCDLCKGGAADTFNRLTLFVFCFDLLLYRIFSADILQKLRRFQFARRNLRNQPSVRFEKVVIP